MPTNPQHDISSTFAGDDQSAPPFAFPNIENQSEAPSDEVPYAIRQYLMWQECQVWERLPGVLAQHLGSDQDQSRSALAQDLKSRKMTTQLVITKEALLALNHPCAVELDLEDVDALKAHRKFLLAVLKAGSAEQAEQEYHEIFARLDLDKFPYEDEDLAIDNLLDNDENAFKKKKIGRYFWRLSHGQGSPDKTRLKKTKKRRGSERRLAAEVEEMRQQQSPPT